MKNSHRQLSQSHSFYFNADTLQHIPAQSLILPHAFGPNIAHKFISGSTPECVAEADLGGGGGVAIPLSLVLLYYRRWSSQPPPCISIV